MSDPHRRMAFLHEMGLGPVWSARHAAQAAAGVSDEMPYAETAYGETISDPAPAMAPAVARAPVLSMDDAFAASSPPVGETVVEEEQIDRARMVARMDWSQLQETVSECVQCGLCRNRTQTVFGVGDQKARWLFVGEGPGRNEDLQGQPFVGPAGKLLDNMMGAMGLQRGENTYIANIVKCRPTDENRRDRPPSLEEASACMPYLKRQIALIDPTVIVAMGKTAALSLLQLDPATPVSRLRGTIHRYEEIPLIVTYHPAYLLRNLRDKRKTWADLCLAMQTFSA
ncbi:phage-related DNA polymerase [Oxalicibacterium flavum]|uniref:Type-4 uracil-DNA glycosylase n=1 Tax=Oxalicibacterium flavum TaxID=179467 RepID=A0A8J2UK78_9BURK|nr:uracil-DNA glycosylase [Oxalicibacterium flavum]GGC00546.1 phage-related DNA polymerase [Oxalicibacterium flavum]